MSYKLYGSPGTASMCVHWMLLELGVPFEFISLDFEKGDQKKPEYLKINPTGHVPALLIDGVAYGEAAALLMILAERHPEARLAPTAGAAQRAPYLQWMVYLANTLMPAYRLWFYSDEGAGPDNVEATREQARTRIEKVWDRLNGLLADDRPYAMGTHLSTVDFLAGMLARWSRNMPKTAADWPHVRRYVERLRALPSYQETHKREGLRGWI
ncbi:MAG TPA: glutathione S-transferase family protein [Rhizomicrobium sp.]